MARLETFSFPEKTFTQLTNANAESARVQNESKYDILVKATVGATPPSDLDGAIRIRPGEMISADQLFADLFPSLTGANRLYGWSEAEGRVSVSHADA